jgi:EmrB/QacA subfamily drug resistance transporter
MKTINSKGLLILAMSLFLSMVFIDEAAVAVTLPQIQQSFHLSLVEIQWVMNAMFLPIAVLVLFGGKISDHIGHRKTFVIGMYIFLFASVLCTFSSSGLMLIIGRALQGVGASLLLATYAVLISTQFSNEERGLALGTCASYAAIFLAVGPFLGGWISHVLNWRWVFALNFPLAPIILMLVYKSTPADILSADKKERFDTSGLLLFLLGFSGLVFSLMQAVIYGWESNIIKLTLASSFICLFIFTFVELKVESPLADLRLFKNKTFLSGNMILLCTQLVVMCLTYWAIWLQKSLGLSSVMAGVALLPAGLPILIMGKIGGKWLDQYGPRKPILLGSIILCLSMLILALTANMNNYWLAMLGFLGYGIGAPLIISPGIATVLNSVSDEKKGMAAGMLNTMRQLGAALCFAIVGVVITNYVHLHSTEAVSVSPEIYSQGFSYGMFVASAFSIITVLFAFFGLKTKE